MVKVFLLLSISCEKMLKRFFSLVEVKKVWYGGGGEGSKK